MDLYTLTDQFLAKDEVDEFISAIWTERYSSMGEVQLVVPATPENLEKLADGTFLALRGTKEVMVLETVSIEDQLMTIVGNSLLGFLNNRLSWFANPAYNDEEEGSPPIVDYTQTVIPGQFLANVVDKMVINPVSFAGDWTNVNLNWEYERIDHLELGPVDTTGAAKRLTIPTGPLYEGLEQLAIQEELGISLYLDLADELAGYVLKFTTYRGKDRTTGSAHPLVRLVPDMDSLSEIKEVRSRANHKNVVYVQYKGKLYKYLAEPALPEPEGFARRVLVVDAQGEPVGRKRQSPWAKGLQYFYAGGSGGESNTTSSNSGWSDYVVTPADLTAFLNQQAKDALANHNYILAIDGQTSPNADYKYGVDYGLGDVIELEGLTGAISKARITEYIRSQDKSGEKEYPTISVL